MARHTIGDKRGSVRGAPPDVYIPFGSFSSSERSAEEAMRPVIRFFGMIFQWMIFYLVAILVAVVWYALTEPE